MTTLLAFFIVLCSLADDQTGANLYRGTGSFVRALDSAGLQVPVENATSSNAIVRDDTAPFYLPEDTKGLEASQRATGPDDESNQLRIIERNTEVYKRFLNELGRFSSIDQLPEISGEIVIDVMSRYPRKPPYLRGEYKRAFLRVAPLLRRESHRVEFVVWSKMPSPTAWQTASETAEQFYTEMLKLTGDKEGQSQRLIVVAKTWPFSDVKRPYASLIVQKVAADE